MLKPRRETAIADLHATRVAGKLAIDGPLVISEVDAIREDAAAAVATESGLSHRAASNALASSAFFHLGLAYQQIARLRRVRVSDYVMEREASAQSMVNDSE